MSQSDGPRTPARGSAGAAELPGGSAGQASGGQPSDGAASGRAQPTADVVWIHGPTEDQKGLRVLRATEESFEIGEVRPIQEGKPVSGEIIKLRPRAGMPRLCDVETQLSREELDRARGAQRPSLGHPGPARVSSEAYRANWDAIYRSANAPGSDELN